MASKHYRLLTCALLSACEQLIQLLNFVNTWIFLFRWMHMLVSCSSALLNKLTFWGLYWHLTAWLELMWLNSWKNTMGCLSSLPKITVGEEGLVNTWADLHSVVQLFQWNAHTTTFEAWGLLTLPEQAQIEQISGLFYVCEKQWSLKGLKYGQPSAALFSGEKCMCLQAWLLCWA